VKKLAWFKKKLLKAYFVLLMLVFRREVELSRDN